MSEKEGYSSGQAPGLKTSAGAQVGSASAPAHCGRGRQACLALQYQAHCEHLQTPAASGRFEVACPQAAVPQGLSGAREPAANPELGVSICTQGLQSSESQLPSVCPVRLSRHNTLMKLEVFVKMVSCLQASVPEDTPGKPKSLTSTTLDAGWGAVPNSCHMMCN